MGGKFGTGGLTLFAPTSSGKTILLGGVAAFAEGDPLASPRWMWPVEPEPEDTPILEVREEIGESS